MHRADNVGITAAIPPDLEHLNLADQFHSLLNQPEGYISRLVTKIGQADAKTKRCIRLTIDVGGLRSFDSDICDALFKFPSEVILAVKEVVNNILRTEHYMCFLKLQNAGIPLEIGFNGSFGKYQITPRGISSKFLGKLVRVEGTVTKLSPKLVSDVDQIAPTDKENMKILPENRVIDVRSAILQECPESIPSGQLPRSVHVFLPYELGEDIRPGQRVRISGLFTTNPFPVLEANHVSPVEKLSLAESVNKTKVVDYFKAYLNAKNMEDEMFEKMAQSVAPSMLIDETIKQALLLQLFGGCRRRSKSGLTVRGDIHCLLIGSPGVGKSQLLRSMHKLAPQCIITSGRGSTAAGLTAAIKTDQYTKIKTLEAGAVVMADGGFVCIDEFDKMSDKDRVALHEAMEQQTVTIAKAGLHTTLNARCSVLAAANPLYGSYNENISLHKNLALPDSLLSRFDLLFLLFDRANTSHDRDLANHVLSLRRGLAMKQTLDSGFLQRYVAYARKEVQPVLSTDARALIVAEYVDLRSEARTKLLPATPRLLETLIRLVTASARAHLRNVADVEDCRRVFKIMRRCLLGYDSTTSTNDTVHDKRKLFLSGTIQLEQDGKFEISFEELLKHLNKTTQGTFTAEDIQHFSSYFQEQGEFDVEDGKIYF